ncbi:NB-ARC domain-containing protein [Actinokineospora sp. 24-640]
MAGHVIQAGVIGGPVNIGVHHHAHRPEVEWPVRVGIPVSAPGHYIDRSAQVDLNALFGYGAICVSGLPLVTTVVISGMAGVGKTQIAAAHARDAAHPTGIDLLVWANAATRDGIRAAYGRSAAKLLLAPADVDPDEAAQTFLEWLTTTTRRWLVVLDDLATPGDSRGLWPPATDYGRTVVTTRYRGNALEGSGRRVVALQAFTAQQSRAHLDAELTDLTHPATQEDFDGLATHLDHLPLALSHAVAFLRDQAITVPEYRRRLRDLPLHTVFHEDPSDLSAHHSAPVHITLSLSVPLAERLAPDSAMRMLLIASLLDPPTASPGRCSPAKRFF